MTPHWYELVRQLQTSPDNDSGQPRKSLDQTNVSSLLTEAVRVASQDSDWNSSGLPESLQRALDLCDKQGPAAASAAALRLLDFQHIVEAKSSNSPKGSPKQGPSLAPTTEPPVPRVEPQRKDSQSCTSVPVITIKRSSESRSIPTTTTIVLQPSSVNSSAAQHSRPVLVNPLAEPTLSLQSTPRKNGAHESTKLHVLKSKNGRSNGSQHTALSKSSPHTDAAVNQPSHIVREVSNDSDKSCESAGTAKRSRPQNNGADSPAVAESSKRQKGLCGLERVVSLSTVLRCVDTRADKEGSFDAAVGQRSATVHEVTEGLPDIKSRTVATKLHSGSSEEDAAKTPAVKVASTNTSRAAPGASGASLGSNRAGEEKPATVTITLSADSAQRLKAQAAESGLHQSDSGLARVLGDNPQIFASVIGPPISGQISPLSFPPLPLSSPPPLVQVPMHIPPLKLEPLQGGSSGVRFEAKLPDPRQIDGAQLQSSASTELDQGSLQTSLWSGKVKHKLGHSTVDLFYMTALIPEKYLEQFPPTLFVTSLATQKDVKLGRHFVMRCRLDFLTEKQLGKLQMLAQGKVVAICRLQHCTVTLVPYYDKHRALRVVGFMLSDE
ncbi:hypothetical protein WJX79_010618 [Trebouxia sp. C0005]